MIRHPDTPVHPLPTGLPVEIRSPNLEIQNKDEGRELQIRNRARPATAFVVTPQGVALCALAGTLQTGTADHRTTISTMGGQTRWQCPIFLSLDCGAYGDVSSWIGPLRRFAAGVYRFVASSMVEAIALSKAWLQPARATSHAGGSKATNLVADDRQTPGDPERILRLGRKQAWQEEIQDLGRCPLV
jgi:hypothetical protein